MPENKKITDLQTFYAIVNRTRFNSLYAELIPPDLGSTYRCFKDGGKGRQLTDEDILKLKAGITKLIKDLEILRQNL